MTKEQLQSKIKKVCIASGMNKQLGLDSIGADGDASTTVKFKTEGNYGKKIFFYIRPCSDLDPVWICWLQW